MARALRFVGRLDTHSIDSLARRVLRHAHSYGLVEMRMRNGSEVCVGIIDKLSTRNVPVGFVARYNNATTMEAIVEDLEHEYRTNVACGALLG